MAIDNIFGKKNSQNLLHGTTTVGVCFKDGIAIVADKRASAGSLIASKRAKKIHKITDHIAITISGSVADAQVLVRWLQSQARIFYLNTEREPLISELVSLLSNVLHSYFKSLLPFITHFIVGGVDVLGPHIVFLDHAGSIQEEKYIATGSGSPIALGVLEDGYEENLTKDKAIHLALNALRSAIRRDVYSGDGLDLVTITKKAGLKIYSPKEIEKYIQMTSLELKT